MAISKYSVEVTAQEAAAHTPSNPNVMGGRVRYAYATYETTTSTGDADGTSIAMIRLPPGSLITSLKVWCDDMGSSSQAMDIGIFGADGSGYYDLDKTLADDEDLIESNMAVDSAVAGTEIIAALADLNTYKFDKEVYLAATAETATWDADKTLTFVCEYVVD
jgi:hypothetical protein